MELVQAINFVNSVLLDSSSASLLALSTPAGPVAGAIFGAVNGAFYPIARHVSKNVFQSENPRASETAKVIASIIPWILGSVCAYFATLACGFELSLMNVTLLGIAGPILGALGVEIVEIAAGFGMLLATCISEERIRAAFQNNL